MDPRTSVHVNSVCGVDGVPSSPPTGPETLVKPPLSLFSHPQQPFHHMDSLHQLGPPTMAPSRPLGPPPITPAQAMGPPTMAPTQTLGPRPISAAHTLRPPPIVPTHNLGPPLMVPAQPLGPPPMVHTLGPPPVDHTQAMVRPSMDLTQPMGPPPVNHSHPLVPPPVVVPGAGRFPLPHGPEPSQLLPRPPGLIPGPLPGQAARSSEMPQDGGSLLGREEQEDPLGLEELCKPLYCKLCNVTLNSAQQAQAHYQVSCRRPAHLHSPTHVDQSDPSIPAASLCLPLLSKGKNHSKKLRNFYAGSQQPPAIRIPEVLEAAGQTAPPSGSTDSDTGRQVRHNHLHHGSSQLSCPGVVGGSGSAPGFIPLRRNCSHFTLLVPFCFICLFWLHFETK